MRFYIKTKKNIFIIASLFFILSSINSVYAATDQADVYEITITKIEICESSNGTTCVNPFTIGSASKDFDIASASVGAEIGTYATLDIIPKGTTATHMRVTMDRAFRIRGSVAGVTGVMVADYSCGTDSAAAAATTTVPGQGIVDGGGTTTQTLIVPNEVADGGPVNDGTYANYGITLISDAQMQMVMSLGSTITMGDIPPVIDIAFGTTNALQANNNGANGCDMTPFVPDVTVDIIQFD
mgnify:FL=1